mmetsp:Transcript_27611/g.47949  ORF Transcript_27611/g.47949 Transcript_27611/m.47949 type:complete len:466 (+) Transcript_27611:69-1466(+)
MEGVARTCEMPTEPASQWPAEDYWQNLPGRNFVIKRTFLENCEYGEDAPEPLLTRERLRSKSDTDLLMMLESDDSQLECSLGDFPNSRGTGITKSSESEDVYVETDAEDDSLDEFSGMSVSTEKSECGTSQVHDQGAHNCWELEEQHREQIAACPSTGVPMVPMPGPVAFQNCVQQGECMVYDPNTNTSHLCRIVTVPTFYQCGYVMEQAHVDACGSAAASPQLTASPSPILCSEAAPAWSADDYNAHAQELLLEAERCKAAARQMTATVETQAPAIQSSEKEPSRHRKKKQTRSIAKQETGMETVMMTVMTTVMLRNIPNNMTRDQLDKLLKSHGFEGLYDFLYLPWDFHRLAGLGYAFVNFETHEYAQWAIEHFQGFAEWGFASDKVCEVCWSSPHQGLQAHVERYRNSPVMHADVPEKYKPLLFINGHRTPFPPPTKKIRAPRMKRCAPFTHGDPTAWGLGQ